MTPGKDSSNAFMAAMAAGAAVCAVQFLLMTGGGFAGAGAPVSTVLWSGLALFLITWMVAAFGFLMGLMLIGLPVWAALSRLGWMSPGVSIVAGALLAPLAGGLLGSMGSGLAGGLPSAAFMVLPGAIAGWTLHRVAYRKAPTG